MPVANVPTSLADAINAIGDSKIRTALYAVFQENAAQFNNHYHTLASAGTATSPPAAGPSPVALATGTPPATFPS